MTIDTEGRFPGVVRSRIRSVMLTPDQGRVRIEWSAVGGATGLAAASVQQQLRVQRVRAPRAGC